MALLQPFSFQPRKLFSLNPLSQRGKWKQGFLASLFCCVNGFAFAQAASFFFRQGNNISQLNCSGVTFAPLTNQAHQAFGAGSVLVKKAINLQNDFSVSFVLDFSDTTGVDGGAFIFQADPNATGETFNGLGVKGVNKSVAIIFDAKQNTQFNDPIFDHACIQANGVVDHSAATLLAVPVSIEPLYQRNVFPPFTDVEKKFYHIVTVRWKAGTKELSAWVDGALLIKSMADIVQTAFNGNPQVYWGFAASNTQELRYPASAELQFGYMRFSIGDVLPRMKTMPETDTCFGAPVQAFDQSVYETYNGLSSLTGASWFWAFGDGKTSAVQNPPAHNYTSAGNYQIKFAVTNAFGCTFDTLVRKIQLGAKPVADFGYSPACVNTPITFTDKSTVASGGIFHWDWKLGSVATSTVQNPVIRFSTAGTQTIYLNVRSNLGCEADTVKTITVGEKPLLNATHSEDCFGNVQYKAFLLNNVNINWWQWEFGDGKTSVQQNPLHHFSQNGNYNSALWATSKEGCTSNTVVQNISVDVVKAFAGRDTVAVKGEPLQLKGSGNGKYSWTPSIGLTNPLISTPVATLYNNQTYVLTVTNDKGCEDKDTLKIRVFNDADIYVPSAFTPNGDGKNDRLTLVAPGFKQLLYFRVYNRWGQTVFETKESDKGWDGIYGGKAMPTGVYVWIASGIDVNSRRLEKKGTVLLLR